MPPIKQQIACPQCKFPNAPGARRCLTCKADLASYADTARLTRTEHGADLTRTRVGAGEDADEPAALRPTARDRGPLLAPPVACLWCDPLPPIPLVPGSKIVIGRQAECDLVLPHKAVSRQHTAVRVLGQDLVFEDTSFNGTYLNGKRVSSGTLRVGDVLTLGPYDVEVQPAAAAGAAVEDSEGTRPLDTASLTNGMIENVPLQLTLQEIEFNRKSGTLSILSGRLRGKLLLSDGVPLSASFGDLRDEAAVQGMLALQEGRFTFLARPVSAPRTIQGSLTGLMLEFNRQRDEALR